MDPLNPAPCRDLERFIAGALDDIEHADFELHLVECAKCREEHRRRTVADASGATWEAP